MTIDRERAAAAASPAPPVPPAHQASLGADASGEARSAYDAWHDAHGVDEDVATPWHLMVRRELDEERDIAGRTVLEIGCGRGGFACWLARRERAPRLVHAADFSQAAVEKGRAFASAHGIDGIDWRVEDIQDIRLPDASVDTAISCETIEHVPDPARAVRELARVLRPGGRLFLTTPNYLGAMGLYRGYLRLTGRRYTEGGQPINNFVMLPRTVAWVRAAGLRVERVEAVGHYLLVPGRTPLPLPAMDRLGWLTRWAGLHSLVVGVRA